MLGRVEFSIVKHLDKTTDMELINFIYDWVIDQNITLECLEYEDAAAKILLDAIKDDYLDAVMFFIENKLVEPTVAHNSPLMDSSIYGHLNIIKYLLKYEPTEEILNKAFCHAATEGHFEIVQYFLENTKANPTTLENVSINMALGKGHADVVLLLASHPKVITTFAKYNQDGVFKEISKKVEDLITTVKSALENSRSRTCLFFHASTNQNNLLNELLKELNLSNKQLKNILSIKDRLLSLGDERAAAEENTNQLK